MSVHTFGPQDLFLHRKLAEYNLLTNTDLYETPFGPLLNLTQWNMYDALTGNYICSIVNGTSILSERRLTTDANGNLLLLLRQHNCWHTNNISK